MELLSQIIGQQLRDILIQQYHLDGDLVDPFNVVFLKFSFWLHLSVGDGVLTIKKTESPSPIDDFVGGGSKFSYPFEPLSDKHPAKSLIGKKVVSVKQLVWKEGADTDEVYGVVFKMTGNAHLIVVKKNSDQDRSEVFTDLQEIPNDLRMA